MTLVTCSVSTVTSSVTDGDDDEEGAEIDGEGGILFLAKNSSFLLRFLLCREGEDFFLVAGGSTLPSFLVSKENVSEEVLRVKVNWMPLLVIPVQNSIYLMATLESSAADILWENLS